MTKISVETLAAAMTPEHALVARRYLREEESASGAASLAIVAPRQPQNPPLKKGLLLEFLLALDEARGDASVTRLDLGYEGLTGKALEQVFATRWFQSVERLRLTGNRASAKSVGGLAEHGRSLISLDLSHVKIGKGVAKLSGLPHLARLRLAFAGIDSAATSKLAAAELPALHTLDLSGWGLHATASKLHQDIRDGYYSPPPVTSTMVKALLGSALGQALRDLTILDANLSRPACKSFGAATLPALERLCLNGTTIADRGAIISGQLPVLRVLECNEGFSGTALAQASFLPHVEVLLVPKSQMSDDEVCQLLRETPKLRSLSLASVGIGASVVAALVEHGAGLRQLRLMWNGLDDAHIEALMKAPWLGELETLGLSNNHFGAKGIAAIAAAPLAVTTLGLGSLQLDAEEIAPLWGASWLPQCRTLSVMNNRLDDDVVTGLCTLDPQCTLHVHGNILSRDALATLTEKFGASLRPGNQYMYKRGQPRAPQDAEFGIGFRHKALKEFVERVVEVPAWAEATTLAIVVTEPIGRRFVARAPGDGPGELFALLGKDKDPVPLEMTSEGLDVAGIRVASGFSIDSPLVIGVPGHGVYTVDVHTSVLGRIGDAHEQIDDLICDNERIAILHRSPGERPRIDWYIGASSGPGKWAKHGEVANLDRSLGTVEFESRSKVLLAGPPRGETGAVRFFALDKGRGMAPMGGFSEGFFLHGGGIARDGHAWVLEDLKGAMKRAFTRLDDAAASS